MALDREDTLRKAEKLLRQGRLDGAIAEYARLVEEYPRDWTSANALGDLLVRAGQVEKAAAQFERIADHFYEEGFLSKAAALYKKILKIRPGDERAQLQLAEIAARQGLLADAKAYLAAVGEQRRQRGDQRGADEILVRLGQVDPSDLDARLAGARALVSLGDRAGALAALAGLASELVDRDRTTEAAQVWQQIVQLDPTDRASRAQLARLCLNRGDLEGAQEVLTREVAGSDPDLLLAWAELALRVGRLDEAREAAAQALTLAPQLRERLVQRGWQLCDTHADAAFVCLDVAAEAAAAAGEFADAAGLLNEFTTRVPNHIPALMKLIEICVDGGLEATMYLAQAQLADAYLHAGRAQEARVIAEDLVAREPWERAHIERFRQALILLGEPDPDAVIADRLSGSSPFVSTDRFAKLLEEPLEEPAAPAASLRVEVAPPASPAPPAGSTPPTPSEQRAAPASPGGVVEIDLTAVLDHLTPEPPSVRDRAPGPEATLDQVFGTLRDEAAREAAAGAAVEQIALARAYREAGLVDEAVAALEEAARSPRHRFEAASMLARIHRERGRVGQAVEWLERAAEAPAPDPEQSRAVLYELGELLEHLGEPARALAVFLELHAEAGDYRDVTARIERLARVET